MTKTELLKSFDARVWAKEFIRCVKINSSISTDEDCMTKWFANALMCGYDQKTWETNIWTQ